MSYRQFTVSAVERRVSTSYEARGVRFIGLGAGRDSWAAGANGRPWYLGFGVDGDSKALGLAAEPCLVLALLGAVLAPTYWPTMVALVRIWEIDPNYSHGFLVPAASLLLAAVARRRHGGPVGTVVGPGAALSGAATISFGLALHVAASFAANLLFDVVSLVYVLRGLLLLVGGREAQRVFAFAVLFLVFMAPLPAAWYQSVALGMQQLASSASTHLLELCGVPALGEGCFVHLPGYTMEVGHACSGLRQLTAVLALGVAIGYLSGRGRSFRWTLALLSMPIAIAANCIRVVLAGVILVLFGREWADGVFHTLEGLATVALAAGLVAGAACGLARAADWVKRVPSAERGMRSDAPGPSSRELRT